MVAAKKRLCGLVSTAPSEWISGSAGDGRTAVIGGGQTMKGLWIGVVLFAILVLSGCASTEGPGSGQRMPRASPGMGPAEGNGNGGGGGY